MATLIKVCICLEQTDIFIVVVLPYNTAWLGTRYVAQVDL